jgi:hypothetical protein
MLEAISISNLVKAAYLAATCFCIGASFRGAKKNGRPHRKLWRTFTVILAVLSLNAYLRLLPQATQLLRETAMRQGWYYDRWSLQVPLEIAVAVVASIAFYSLWRNMRNIHLFYRLLIPVMALLLVLILTLTISFHITDKILYWEIAGFRLHYLLQMAGLLYISGAALVAMLERSTVVAETLDLGVKT